MTPELEYLYGLELFGIKLGLDTIRQLLAAAGDPQKTLATVHVAGTNGKGSVLAMLDAILRAAGYRTGRFTSPHLIHVNERFLLNSTPISGTDLDTQIRFFRDLAADFPHSPTFFELNTAIAFRWFAEQQPDLALIEVGMGGRFDSTNVIEPVATAITNVSLEHTAYLGDTVEKIAFEKAGIIKRGVPCVVTEEHPGPQRVILDLAEQAGAPVRLAGRDLRFRTTGTPLAPLLHYASPAWAFDGIPLALPGLHQGSNAAVAIALAEMLQPRFPRITRAAVIAGLGAARWPCRMEKILDAPPVYMDVAHNPAGMARLAQTLPRAVVVLGCSADKDAAAMLDAIAPVATRLVLTRFDNRRAMPLEQLNRLAAARSLHVEPVLRDALDWGIVEAQRTGHPLVVTGSVFLAGEARQLLVDGYGARPLAF